MQSHSTSNHVLYLYYSTFASFKCRIVYISCYELNAKLLLFVRDNHKKLLDLVQI